MPPQIAIVGQSVIDRVTAPDLSAEERLGGSPIFAAEAMSAGRWRGVILTRGGTQKLRAPLREFGLPVVVGPSSSTIVSLMDLRADGTRSEEMAAMGDPFTPTDVRTWMAPSLAISAAVVCGAQWRDDFPPETLIELAAAGRPVYLDAQGPARPSRLGPLELEGPLDPELVRGVTVLKLAEEEVYPLLGEVDAAAAEATGVPVVVVTLGERGAVVFVDGAAHHVGAEPIFGLADTVGAGDAFLAVMAAAHAAGQCYPDAAQTACENVAAILRRRLERERAQAAGVPVTAPRA